MIVERYLFHIVIVFMKNAGYFSNYLCIVWLPNPKHRMDAFLGGSSDWRKVNIHRGPGRDQKNPQAFGSLGD